MKYRIPKHILRGYSQLYRHMAFVNQDSMDLPFLLNNKVCLGFMAYQPL